jgi:thiamine-phosphate pyrophosphorylase
MVIVISNPTMLENEAVLINELFDHGLQLFHLRKPNYSKEELRKLLNEIDASNYPKIALHQRHELAKEFGIKRLHFTEELRIGITPEYLCNNDFILSTSVHSVEDLEMLHDVFEYAFLSPVFDSISKPDYKAVQFDLSVNSAQPKTKVIGLGGITSSNYQKAMKMGFDGVALLGAIWHNPNGVQEFQKIMVQCSTSVQ